MIPISLEEYMEQHVKSNPGTNVVELRKALEVAVQKKQEGKECDSCGSKIWAIGTALVGWDACFSCITGESNDSGDYEIIAT